MKDQAVGNSRVEKGIFRSSQSEPSCFHRCKSAICCNARSSSGKTCGNEQSFPATPGQPGVRARGLCLLVLCHAMFYSHYCHSTRVHALCPATFLTISYSCVYLGFAFGWYRKRHGGVVDATGRCLLAVHAGSRPQPISTGPCLLFRVPFPPSDSKSESENPNPNPTFKWADLS